MSIYDKANVQVNSQQHYKSFRYQLFEVGKNCLVLKYSEKSFNHITKTHLYVYNSDPLKPHFYIVKLGFTGVYIIFLISAQKHRLQKYEKYQKYYLKTFSFLVVKFSINLNMCVCVMNISFSIAVFLSK